MNSIRDTIFIREKLGAVKLYRSNLLKILWAIQDEYRHIPQRFIRYLCDRTELTPEAIHSVVSFYHFFSLEHRGDITIYLDTSITSEMTGAAEVRKAFEDELGIKVGEVTSDMQFGLFETSCMGLSDQGPAALINHRPATFLTAKKVSDVIKLYKSGSKLPRFPKANILKSGPIFFQEIKAKKLLKKLFTYDPVDVVELVKQSGLKGRGGAGFPAGIKWEFCRNYEGPRYLFANGDEGEPGTFKDRALLMKSAKSLFLGMIIAGYALGAMRGYLYLRAEYFYMLESLEEVLTKLRRKGLLGQQILGSNFSYEISIKFGAGAYICGAETALIESAEGKRGEPRNRPPFPAQNGYLGKPTAVNNLETLCNLPVLIDKGLDWYMQFGTQESTGTKLISVAGDCDKPGVYEFEHGVSVQDILNIAGAKNTRAVQISGPAGTLIASNEFDRKICFEDLPCGGAFTIFNDDRVILEIIKNHANFFMEESCGFCVPCRAGTVLINELLDKTLAGKGVAKDLEQLNEIANIVNIASRCGLGRTAGNPIIQSLEKFRDSYDKRVSQELEFISEFDLEESLRKAREGIS